MNYLVLSLKNLKPKIAIALTISATKRKTNAIAQPKNVPNIRGGPSFRATYVRTYSFGA